MGFAHAPAQVDDARNLYFSHAQDDQQTIAPIAPRASAGALWRPRHGTEDVWCHPKVHGSQKRGVGTGT